MKTALSKATSFSRRLNHVQFFQLLLMCYAGANPACDENAEVYILPEGYNPLDTGGSFEISNIYCIMDLAKAEHEVYISEY